MFTDRILNAQLDVRIRPADRSFGYWQSSGDIIERYCGRLIGRVYGRGRNSALAEQEVAREAERWLHANRRSAELLALGTEGC